MSRVQDPTAELVLALPPIALSELREPTKDYLLAKANAGHTPAETLKELLDRGAERDGFWKDRGSGAGEQSHEVEGTMRTSNIERPTSNIE